MHCGVFLRWSVLIWGMFLVCDGLRYFNGPQYMPKCGTAESNVPHLEPV